MGFKDATAKKRQHLAASEAITAPWIVKGRTAEESAADAYLEMFSAGYGRLFSVLVFADLLVMSLSTALISQWVEGIYWPFYAMSLLSFLVMAGVTRTYLLSDSQYMLGKFLTIGCVVIPVQLAVLLNMAVPAATIFCALSLTTAALLGLAVVHHGLTRQLMVPHQTGLYYQIECRIKRGFDLMMAGLLLVLFVPVLLAIMVGIFLFDRGPAIFKQKRVGFGGKDFTLLKFRSMMVNAEKRKSNLAAEQRTDKKSLFKMEDDPRVTGWGRMLRNFSLDELPQLINVLRGDMSLVGPRPPLPSEYNEMTSHHRRKFDVPPGMTGLWQITGRVRNERSFDAVASYDIAYIEQWSALKDIGIILKTIPVVLGQKGAS